MCTESALGISVSVGIPRHIIESGTQKEFLPWDSCDCISSLYDFVDTLITSLKQVHVQNQAGKNTAIII